MKEVKNSKRKARREKSRPKAKPVSWETPNAANILALITAVEGFDGAVRFGRTRDGGSYALGIYEGGDNWTEYWSGSEGVDKWLSEIIDDLTA